MLIRPLTTAIAMKACRQADIDSRNSEGRASRVAGRTIIDMGSHFRLRASYSSGRGSTSARHRRLSWLSLIRQNAAEVLVVVRQRSVKACHGLNAPIGQAVFGPL